MQYNNSESDPALALAPSASVSGIAGVIPRESGSTHATGACGMRTDAARREMRIYNNCKTGQAAECEVCGRPRYNMADVIDHGRCIAERAVAERRRKIDIGEFVTWFVRANLDIYIDANDPVVTSTIEKHRHFHNQRICSKCENELYESVKVGLLTP